jgi:hypothetical protein
MISFLRRTSCVVLAKPVSKLETHPTKSVMSTSRPLELLHIDLFGPTTNRSIGGNSYGLVAVHDY